MSKYVYSRLSKFDVSVNKVVANLKTLTGDQIFGVVVELVASTSVSVFFKVNHTE